MCDKKRVKCDRFRVNCDKKRVVTATDKKTCSDIKFYMSYL